MAGVVVNTREAYTERTRSLRFHSRWVKSGTAMKAVDVIGKYNKFKAEPVKDAIDRIQRNDPNARFSIGREGSPVIYVETGKPRSALGVFSSMSKNYRPDEIDKVIGGPRAEKYRGRLPKKRSSASVVRAWWD